MIFRQIESLLSKYDLNLKTPICEIPGYAMQEILYGSLENVKIEKEKVHTSTDYFCAYDGIIDYLQKVMEDDESAARNGPTSLSLPSNALNAMVCDSKRIALFQDPG